MNIIQIMNNIELVVKEFKNIDDELLTEPYGYGYDDDETSIDNAVEEFIEKTNNDKIINLYSNTLQFSYDTESKTIDLGNVGFFHTSGYGIPSEYARWEVGLEDLGVSINNSNIKINGILFSEELQFQLSTQERGEMIPEFIKIMNNIESIVKDNLENL